MLSRNPTVTVATGGNSEREVAGRTVASYQPTMGVRPRYLEAGLVDEMLIHQVPILLGDGERLFERVTDLHGLELVETVAAPNVTQLRFLKRWPASSNPLAQSARGAFRAVTISK